MMTKSILAVTLALGLSAGIAGAASADQLSLVQPTVTPQATESAAVADYRANVNPDSNVPTTGIYDERDRYVGPNGFPLPGDPTVNAQN